MRRRQVEDFSTKNLVGFDPTSSHLSPRSRICVQTSEFQVSETAVSTMSATSSLLVVVVFAAIMLPVVQPIYFFVLPPAEEEIDYNLYPELAVSKRASGSMSIPLSLRSVDSSNSFFSMILCFFLARMRMIHSYAITASIKNLMQFLIVKHSNCMAD